LSKETGSTGAEVYVARASSYEEEELFSAVGGIAESAGGWDAIAPPGKPVLVKPNLMAAREPGRAVTTHPALIEVIATILKRRGREV
jgi:uncharacterized protein (DUF362 family)